MFNLSSLKWWVILIIILCVVILYFVIPWKKLSKKNKQKNDLINKPKDKKIKYKNDNYKPMFGIYNWFGKKEALRLKSLIYVAEVKDCCKLCQPFENQVLSLEKYDKKYITMSEAISKGYHHVGCKHKDINYFPGDTIIPKKKYTTEEQNNYHKMILHMYKLENEIRNIKYKIDNDKNTKKRESQLLEAESNYLMYCQENSLVVNKKRLNPSIKDIEKFTNNLRE